MKLDHALFAMTATGALKGPVIYAVHHRLNQRQVQLLGALRACGMQGGFRIVGT
jgi:hypothetical protein